jgi:hypothetical protein
VGFEPTIAVLERAKTVRALDRSVTAIGLCNKLKIHMDKVTILPVVLYWSVTSREHKLKMLEKKVLKGTFGPKTDETAEG